MLSCPVRLSESAAPSPPPPPRVTSFAEIARNKRRSGGSPSQKGGMEATSMHSHSSGEFSPILEDLPQGQSHSLPPLTRCHSQGSCDLSSPHRPRSTPPRESPGGAGKQTRTKAEGKDKFFSKIFEKKGWLNCIICKSWFILWIDLFCVWIMLLCRQAPRSLVAFWNSSWLCIGWIVTIKYSQWLPLTWFVCFIVLCGC